jgi:pyruvate, water dikinase
MKYIKFFDTVSLKDIALVGGKNANLGEMISNFRNVNIPYGFAITTNCYDDYLEYNNNNNLNNVSTGNFTNEMKSEIIKAYYELSNKYGDKETDVAVRSSATAEDLDNASFAGQQDTFLNIRGVDDLLIYIKKCFASLYTDRAINYRDMFYDKDKHVSISVGIQKMVRSDLGSSGVAFSIDTESGFKDVIVINGAYGLGETIVQGLVKPDEYIVHKTTLEQGYNGIIYKQIGI